MKKTTLLEALPELWEALGQTALMVSLAFAIAVVIGTVLGVLLITTATGGLLQNRPCNAIFGAIINLGRSLPFIILLIAIIPLTRLIVGTAFGPEAAVVPLAVGSIPFFARVVESALREVARGKIEAAQAMGANSRQIVTKVLLPEAAPSLVSGATLALVMLVGFSAMAGTIGGGGLGDFAIRYGYQRFNTPVLLMAVILLIIVVQAVQSMGDFIVRRMAHLR